MKLSCSYQVYLKIFDYVSGIEKTERGKIIEDFLFPQKKIIFLSFMFFMFLIVFCHFGDFIPIIIKNKKKNLSSFF